MIEASQTQPRLPDDLERLVDPALLSKPDGLTVACYAFPTTTVPPITTGCSALVGPSTS